MDTSDFYKIAVDALEALDDIKLPTNKQMGAIIDLRDFIRAADMERDNNKDNSHDRHELRSDR